MADLNEIDRRVLGALDGRERLKALLRDAGYGTLQDFAQATGLWTQQVSMCLAGVRPYPEIRDALAARLEITREQVDALIGTELEDVA